MKKLEFVIEMYNIIDDNLLPDDNLDWDNFNKDFSELNSRLLYNSKTKCYWCHREMLPSSQTYTWCPICFVFKRI